MVMHSKHIIPRSADHAGLGLTADDCAFTAQNEAKRTLRANFQAAFIIDPGLTSVSSTNCNSRVF